MRAKTIDTILELSVVGSFTRLGYITRKLTQQWSHGVFDGSQHIVITGASSGLGRSLALHLAAPNRRLSLIGRDNSRLTETVSSVAALGGTAEAYQCDVSDLTDLKKLVSQLGGQSPADVLVNNAGALTHGYRQSPQGIEHTVAVHVLAPYVLQRDLVMNPRGKVITMTSGGMYAERFDLNQLEMTPENYRGTTAYARAKRAQVVLTSALQRQEGNTRSFYAVHPGWARTPGLDEALPLFSKLLRPVLRTSEEGADTTAWLATQPEGEPKGGGLWFDRRERSIYRLGKTAKTAEEERRDESELLAWLESRSRQ